MLRPFLLFSFVLVATATAQVRSDPEEGAPHAYRMGWDDYQGHSQNWAVTQSSGGLIYVANTWGVMEYDGGGWRMMPFGWDARTLVRSIAVGRSGRLYVGGSGELGVLVPDSTQTLGFQSLVHAIPARMRDFSDVWSTHATPGGIVFQTPEYLYRWTGSRMQAWKASASFHLAFVVDGLVYVREEGVGLKVLDGDDLRLVPGGEAFAERRIFALMPHPRGLLAAVRDEGLWTIGRQGAAPMDSEAGPYLQQYRPYGGLRIAGRGSDPDLYAISSFGGGVVVMDGGGRIVRIHREDVGLEPDDFILGMAQDQQGGLWLGLIDGIAHLDLMPRFTEFGSREGLTGVVYVVERYEGQLYVGTSTGLFRLVPGRSGRDGDGPAYSRFESVPSDDGDVSQTWSLLSTSGGLLVGSNGGLFWLRDGRLVRLSDRKTLRLSFISGRADVMVGEKDGLRLMRRTADGWTLFEPFAEADGEINSFVSIEHDTWVGLMDGRVFRVSSGPSGYHVDRYGLDDGIADGPATVVEWGGSFRVIQQAGVLKPMQRVAGLHFERDPTMLDLDGQYSLFSGQNQRQWLYRDEWLATVGQRSRGFRMQMNWAEVSTVREEPTGVIWIGTNSGLYRYDPRVPQPTRPFPAFVRRVTDSRRETLYGGAPLGASVSGQPALVLPYAVNSLRFEYAAAAFSRPAGTEYQFRLDGLDGGDTWSPWAPERSTNYTQLWEGTYTFRVRARDAYGHVGEEASFTLRILPPWYRTVWAYLAYVLLIGGAIWAFTAWRLHKLRIAAEAQRARNARLNRLGERLREANTRLRRAERLKDDLLANTSHELRTPLTAVMGYSEMLLDEIPDDQRDLAEGIHRGGQRLLETVNGLLDMFKLQSGTLDLFPEALNAGEAVRETIRLLRPLADARGLTLRVLPESLALPVVVDQSVLDRIVTNLVGNAIKFTDAGGVDVLLDADDEWLRLTVRDTGSGIPPEMTARIFEPFEQVSTGHARSHEGTGLGLTIVQRLVDLVGGAITVESREGVGTAFRVALPRVAAETPRTRVVVGEQNATLGGAHVFAVCVPDGATDTLAEWLAPTGVVRSTEVPARAPRVLRKTTYDAVFIGADRPDVEAKRTRQLRRVPGYAHTPMLRVGGEPLRDDELIARGFTHQLPLPLDVSAVVPLMEQILSRVESNEEAETLAP